MRLTRSSAFGLLIAVSAPVSARAQLSMDPAQWYINNQIYSTRVFNSTIGTSMASGVRAGASAGAATPRDVTAYVATTSVLPARLSQRSATTPEGRRTAQRMFEEQLQLYHATAKKDGFPSTDLAYAYTYFVVNHYLVAHDLIDVPIDRDPFLRSDRDGFERIELAAKKRAMQVDAMGERSVFEQLRTRLADVPAVRGMTDAEKQEAAESMAIAFGVNYRADLDGVMRGDEALASTARRVSREALERLLGQPIDRIRIGSAGLQP